VTAGQGAGVRVAGVVRASAPAVTAERRIADAGLAREDARAAALETIARALGGPEDASGLVARYQEFETSLRALADNPQNAAAQSRVASSARELTETFNRLSSQFQKIRQDGDGEIARRVASANQSLVKIEELNQAIIKGRTNGVDVSALEDQRQNLIDGVNAFIPARELQRGDGGIDLATPEGVFLIAGSARTIEFNASPLIDAGRAYDGGVGALSGLKIGGVDVTPGGPGAQALKSGAAVGLFAVRDAIAPDAQTKLDALAEDLISRFSDPAVDPTLALGAPGVFTDAGAALASPYAPGLAGRLSLNQIVDPAQGGDPSKFRDGLGSTSPGPAGDDTIVRNFIDAFTKSLTPPSSLGASRDLYPAEAAAFLAAYSAGGLVDAETSQAGAAALQQGLKEAELMETGVDTDKELQNLLIIEQAYAANARVIQAVGEMMDALIRI
jgi:flagellar hook-associated protein 1 FlgK